MNIYNISGFVTGIIEAFAVLMIFDNFLARRQTFKPWTYIAGAVLLALAINLSNVIFKIGTLNVILMLVVVFCYSLMYKSSMRKRVLFSAASYAIMLASEILVLFVLIAVKNISISALLASEEDKFLGTVISKLVMFAAARLICRKKDRQQYIMKTSYYVVFSVAMLTGILTLYLLFELNTQGASPFFANLSVICSGGILFCVFLIFKLYIYLAKEYDRRNRENLLKQQLEAQKRYTDEIIAQQDKLRRVRHDMENHMISVRSYMQAEEYENGVKYIDDLLKVTKTETGAVNTGNRVIDSVITAKKAAAVARGIEFDSVVQIPENIPVDASDCCIVLGNILDNAIEASEESGKEKRIEFSLIYSKPSLICKVKNTAPNRKNKMLKTTKADAENHGIGLENVRYVLEKYNHVMRITQGDGIFTIVFQIYGVGNTANSTDRIKHKKSIY